MNLSYHPTTGKHTFHVTADGLTWATVTRLSRRRWAATRRWSSKPRTGRTRAEAARRALGLDDRRL
jgi:hypothetical protein